MRNGFRSAIRGGEQESDLILVSGGVGDEFGEALVGGEGSGGVARGEFLTGRRFKLRDGLGGNRGGEKDYEERSRHPMRTRDVSAMRQV